VNIKIGNVLRDVFGVSGQNMLLALIDGHATPEQIAGLARGQAKRKIPQLTEALNGHGMSPITKHCVRQNSRAACHTSQSRLNATHVGKLLSSLSLGTNQKARLINSSVSATAFSLPEDHLYHDDSELPRSCKSVT
jgi:hypothetical protein